MSYNVGKLTFRTKEEYVAALKGRQDALGYLCDVAQETQGAEVWRALFGEAIGRVEKELAEAEGK